ncbi:inducible metalloproteinase inhibitor protein-like [Culicoides brevitarsis]|uniref:inducible metalloproteinase inhibitor protein-like n=1 Tax=Culicoides brevitarsis TaxID=469753 RepID=UPI00307C439E
MKFLVVLSLASIAVCVSALPQAADVVPQIQCGKNEVYTDCGNPCTDSCPDGRVCTMQCREMCICADGFKRNSNGVCIEEKLCSVSSVKCKDPNELYYFDNVCTENCFGYLMRCEKQEWGCYCKDGYKRDSNTGKCIPAEQCPREGETGKCPCSFQYYELSSECESVCTDGRCDGTKRYGCWCMKGYKYHAESKKCVRSDRC